MTTVQRKNLLRLADYLDGDLRAEFDMGIFSNAFADDECGTAGCALGHATFFFKKLCGESWERYAKRVFGTELIGGDNELKSHAFLFGGGWKFLRNTAPDTARRIRYFLSHGIPKCWDFSWEPPVEQTTKQEPKVIYRTVVIDKAVESLQKSVLPLQ